MNARTGFLPTPSRLQQIVTVAVLVALVAVFGLSGIGSAIGYDIVGLTSSTHPNDSFWYTNPNPRFDWNSVPQPSEIATLALGQPYEIEVHGETAYVAAHSVIGVLDVTDIESPSVIRNVSAPGTARGVAVDGDTLFVAADSGGLATYDITDPTDPSVLGSYDTTDQAWAVDVHGDWAFVADGINGLVVLDISNTSTPTLAGWCDVGQSCRDVVVDGDYAYLGCWGDELVVVDVSDPTSPSLVTRFDVGGNAIEVAVQGDCAFVAAQDAGLAIVDISDPTSPTALATVDPSAGAGSTLAVDVTGDVLYMTNTQTGISAVDIQYPASPVVTYSDECSGTPECVRAFGEYALLARYGYGLSVYKTWEFRQPLSVRIGSTVGRAREIEISGDWAYAADSTPGVASFFAGAPSALWANGTSTPMTRSVDVDIDGDYVFTAAMDSGLQVVDTSIPGTPTVVGSHDTTGKANDIVVDGTWAYVADGNEGLAVFDVSDPTAPSCEATLGLPGYASGIDVSGDSVYVTLWTPGGIVSVDVTDPRSPLLDSTLPLPGTPDEVVVDGDYAYVAAWDTGFHTVDISEAGTPTLTITRDTGGMARDLAVSGDWLWVADAAWIRGYDIGERTAPNLVYTANVGAGSAWGLCVEGSEVFAALDTEGVRRFACGRASGYSTGLDQTPGTIPAMTSMWSNTWQQLSGVPDGEWWFHVRARAGQDDWTGSIAHRRIRIDTRAPSTTDNAPAGWVNADVQVALSVEDTASGPDDTWWWYSSGGSGTGVVYSSPIDVSSEGATTIKYFSFDNAIPLPNRELTQTVTVYIDKTDPVTGSDAKGSYVDAAAITLSPSDSGGSGLDKTYYSLNGGARKTYTGPISLTSVGEHALKYWSTDVAGNVEAKTTKRFTITSSKATAVGLAGDNRYETAVEISREAFPGGADWVVIATGSNWPDALGGSALAGAYDAPILLTESGSLPAEVAAEITRLGASHAFILGGTAAVSNSVANQLAGRGLTVTRLGGANRYATGRLVAQATIAKLGGTFDGTAFCVTGTNFPDALAGSPIAAAKGWPIYLADPGSTAVASQMKSDGVTDAVILGGTAVVSTAHEVALAGAFGGTRVERLAGADRYETGVEVAAFGVDEAGLGWDGLAIATGANFPDALSGGVLCGRNGSIMLLTESGALPSVVSSTLAANKASIATYYFLGGTGAVSTSVRSQVAAALD